jgi:hypothetical protein
MELVNYLIVVFNNCYIQLLNISLIPVNCLVLFKLNLYMVGTPSMH